MGGQSLRGAADSRKTAQSPTSNTQWPQVSGARMSSEHNNRRCQPLLTWSKYLPDDSMQHSEPRYYLQSIPAHVSIHLDETLKVRPTGGFVSRSKNGARNEIFPKQYNTSLTSRSSSRNETVATKSQLQSRPTGRNISQYNNLLLGLLASLACLNHHASPCFGFNFADYYHSPGLAGDTYPVQQYQSPHLNYWARLPRSYDHDGDPLMGTMSTASGSFSQDPASTTGSQAQSSWTSILNPFGLGQRPPVDSNSGGNNDDFDQHIKKILVPRVSGTPGNIQVREYIVNELRKNDYHVELDKFTDSTPVGKVEFGNIIASSNPNACKQLVLACHYDSKMMDGFLGAIDSAVPCAMLLKLAETFSKSFRPAQGSSSSEPTNSPGLQFIFFDGEEAYVQWSHMDSLYGSRHLADKWAKQTAPEQCGTNKNMLSRIELFVLLDLIGASDSSFVMYNTQLRHHYESLQKYEKAYLAQSGLSQVQARRSAAFKSRNMPMDFVEDDHVPFKKRGVPILLLLASPFPRVWHTTADNYQAIDFARTRRILHVLEEFVSNYPTGG